MKAECQSLIAQNKIEDCLDHLLKGLDGSPQINQLLQLKQKWNQNKKDEALNTKTDDWLEVQKSKIVKSLLDLLE